MLGKLIKYDLKSGFSIIIPTHIFIILCAIFSRTMKAIAGISDGTFRHIFNFLFIASAFILVLSIVAACVITLVIVVLRYRNNLLRDEGYLMHTLPVSPANLYFSKIITAMLFFIMDIVIVILAIILSGMPEEYGIDWNYLKNMMFTFHYGAAEYNVNGNVYLSSIIIMVIVALYLSISQLFASLNIGYGLPIGKGASRDLISVAAYIINYVITQILMVIIIVIPIFISGFKISEQEALQFTQNFLFAVIAAATVLSAIYSFASIKLMQKNLNLE